MTAQNALGGIFMIKAYVRCSTNETRQNLDRQVRDLESQFKLDKVYKEYISGTAKKREQYDLMLDELSEGDTIVATEVSRLSRSTRQFLDLLETVKEKHLRLIVGSMNIDCRNGSKMDIMTETTLKIMSVFSELERNIISERVKSGMANAKSKGKKIGRPEMTVKEIPGKFMDTYDLYNAGKLNITDLAKLNRMSRTTVYKYIALIEKQNQLLKENIYD